MEQEEFPVINMDEFTEVWAKEHEEEEARRAKIEKERKDKLDLSKIRFLKKLHLKHASADLCEAVLGIDEWLEETELIFAENIFIREDKLQIMFADRRIHNNLDRVIRYICEKFDDRVFMVDGGGDVEDDKTFMCLHFMDKPIVLIVPVEVKDLASVYLDKFAEHYKLEDYLDFKSEEHF